MTLKMKKWLAVFMVLGTLSVTGVGAVGVVGMLTLAACRRNRSVDLVALQARGQVIVDALGAYHADHREYPRELSALVPKYIDAIPDPGPYREIWGYDSNKGHRHIPQPHFSLETAITNPKKSSFKVLTFYSLRRRWVTQTVEPS